MTNSFENKTADAMAAISPNFVVAAPDIDAIADALCEASAGTGDFERRARGARVDWSRDWYDSLGDALIERVAEWLFP